MRCAIKQTDGTFAPPSLPQKLPPQRQWRVVLAEIRTREDLLTKQGWELYGMVRGELPSPVQRWQAAFGLMLWLHNGWTDVAWQHLDDLVQGVGGLEDCGFQIGARGGREVIQAFEASEVDPALPDFEANYWKLPDSAKEGLEAVARAIDDRLISETWAAYGDLETKLIARAHDLAATGG